MSLSGSFSDGQKSKAVCHDMMDMHPHSDNNFGCESNHLHYVLEYGLFIYLLRASQHKILSTLLLLFLHCKISPLFWYGSSKIMTSFYIAFTALENHAPDSDLGKV
jgi:hypothetical protein